MVSIVAMGEKEQELRRMPTGWVVALGAIVVVGIAAVATVMIINQGRTAQAVAEQYFEALAAGDASTALSLTEGYDPDWDPESRDPRDGPDLLADEVLAAAVEHISDVSVVPADDPADEFGQKVLVSYTLAGENHSFPLTLTRSSGNKYQIPARFGQWTDFASYGPDTVTVAGVPVHSGTEISPGIWDGRYAAWTQLFPAVYPVAATDPTHFDVKHDELVVTGVGLIPEVELVPTAALHAELQAWGDARLDTCVEWDAPSDNDFQAGCALYVDVLSDNGSPVYGQWEIIEYPTVELVDIGTVHHFDAQGGRAQFTPAPEQGGGGPYEMERDLRYRGEYRIVDGELSVVSIGD